MGIDRRVPVSIHWPASCAFGRWKSGPTMQPDVNNAVADKASATLLGGLGISHRGVALAPWIVAHISRFR